MSNDQPSRMKPFVDSDVFDKVVAGVRAGRYHLILGAGASYGVENAKGPLPLAKDLESILLDEVNQSSALGVGLSRAYEAAGATLGQEAVVELLRALYSGAEPLDWHRLVAQLPWEAMWTLNIDDVMEHAYERAVGRKQRAITILWQDKPMPYSGSQDEMPLVHLHGYVGEIDRRTECQLIFALPEYSAAVRQSAVAHWQTSFRAAYPTAPLIIAGARFNDELDFIDLVRAGNISADYGLPSLIVRPGISDFEKAEYLRWGLVPIDATAEEFFAYLADVVAQDPVNDSADEYETRFTKRTFLELTSEKTDGSNNHDFYAGHAPEWPDIQGDLDAVPAWLLNLTNEIGSPDTCNTRQLLYVMLGSPFSGKSTALLRVGKTLMSQGWRPVYLGGRERIDVQEALKYFASRPTAVLLADNVNMDAGDIGDLLKEAEKADQRLLVFACDRTRHTGHIRNVVPPKHLAGIETRLFREPMDEFWWDVVTQRAKTARLGRLDGLSKRESQLYFVEHARELFSALASLEDAPGFIDSGVGVYEQLTEPLSTAFCSIALLGWHGLASPISAVCAASGVSARVLSEACRTGELAEWVIFDQREPGLVRLRHRYLGDLLVAGRASQQPSRSLAEIALELCIAVADRVDKSAVHRRTLEFRIAANLMNLESVQQVNHSENVDPWYEALESHYGWNARYWEQRALGLKDSLERSFSYAKRAVTLSTDALSLNTLGTVLMRRAAETGDIPSATREKYWTEALDALTQSRDCGHGSFEHPFITFFSYTKRVLSLVERPDASWWAKMEAAYRDWRKEAIRLGMLDDSALRAAISEFPGEWRK